MVVLTIGHSTHPIDEFVALLQDTSLRSPNYQGCYAEVADAIETFVNGGSLPAAQQEYLREFARGMRVWLATFARLSRRSAPSMQLVK